MPLSDTKNSIAPTFDEEEEPSRGEEVEKEDPELTSTPHFTFEVLSMVARRPLYWTVTLQKTRLDKKRRMRMTFYPTEK